MAKRISTISRTTKETAIKIELNIDGTGQAEITTGVLFFDHMLNQLAQHGLFDIKLSASGSDIHHIIEDVAICLGKTFKQAMGERKGIVRMSHAIIPMDESLALVAIDMSGRGYSSIDATFSNHKIGDMPSDLIRHFLISFASESRFNLHVKILDGINDHHKCEAIFKALARALDMASRIDSRITDKYPSTKEYMES